MTIYLGFTTSGIRAALHALLPDGGAPRYIGLLSDFGDASDGSDATEAAVTRAPVSAWTDISPEINGDTLAATTNTNDVTFDAVAGDVAVKGHALYAAASGGEPLAVGILLGEDGTPVDVVNVTTGNQPQFAAGTLLYALSRMAAG
jgi:hypothetical protein